MEWEQFLGFVYKFLSLRESKSPQGSFGGVSFSCLLHLGMGHPEKTDSSDKGKSQGQGWREAGQTRVPSSLPWKQLASAVTSSLQSALSTVGLVPGTALVSCWPWVGLLTELSSTSTLTAPPLSPTLSCSELMFQMGSAGKHLRHVSASCDVFLNPWALCAMSHWL